MPSINFKGKTLVQNYHLLVPFHELKPIKSKSLTDKVSLHDNLVVHGDNLRALKALLPYYHGKVKCIYIDPPYNTGNEKWVYNDNVNSPMMQEWLGNAVDREDLTRHDKWLCMMLPRLKLLREFLTDDGIIFVSIDDNEVHRLRGLMDEVFGEDNFVTTPIWQKKYGAKSDSKFLSESHEFILCYARNIETVAINRLPRTEEQDARYKNPDSDPRGPWTSGDLLRNEARDYAIYEIVSPGGKKHWPPKGTSWRFTKEKFSELVAEKRIWFGEEGNNVPRLKRFLSEVAKSVPATTWWEHKDVGHSDEAKKELRELFPEHEEMYATPKPVRLITRVLSLGCDEDSIVMDAFAGSGTTAQAVLEMNKEDGGQRRFLLIEGEDYADSLTAERIRRVIKGVPKAKDKSLRKGLGGSFSYIEVGEPMQIESLLKGKKLPRYEDLAGYVFYTATGEDFSAKKINKKSGFIGESAKYDVYLFYEPDLNYLKNTALTLDMARKLPKGSGKRRLVFAPTKYCDAVHLEAARIDFCQLPFEIYKAAKPGKS